MFSLPTSHKINMHEEVAEKTMCGSFVQAASLIADSVWLFGRHEFVPTIVG
jgi:hypothetical protein